MKKKVQIILLPTKYFSLIGKYEDTGNLVLNDKEKDIPRGSFMATYFLSDEEIKEGDWFTYNKGYSIIQCKGFENDLIIGYGKHHKSICKKVIATNDKGNMDFPLPQPSQEFIKYYVEQYNKGNIIGWVDVEYGDSECMKTICDDNCSMPNCLLDGQLIINPDNTINISPIKNSWSRDEAVKLLHYFYPSFQKFKQQYVGNDEDLINKWISENLK